jgi:hypothetical protein
MELERGRHYIEGFSSLCRAQQGLGLTTILNLIFLSRWLRFDQKGKSWFSYDSRNDSEWSPARLRLAHGVHNSEWLWAVWRQGGGSGAQRAATGSGQAGLTQHNTTWYPRLTPNGLQVEAGFANRVTGLLGRGVWWVGARLRVRKTWREGCARVGRGYGHGLVSARKCLRFK